MRGLLVFGFVVATGCGDGECIDHSGSGADEVSHVGCEVTVCCGGGESNTCTITQDDSSPEACGPGDCSDVISEAEAMCE